MVLSVNSSATTVAAIQGGPKSDNITYCTIIDRSINEWRKAYKKSFRSKRDTLNVFLISVVANGELQNVILI